MKSASNDVMMKKISNHFVACRQLTSEYFGQYYFAVVALDPRAFALSFYFLFAAVPLA
jgi:hypothetical protein